MPREDYDLVVIGAGSAGSTAAEEAAGGGARVALIEADRLGGTCLNYGCDPTKALLHSASLLHQARNAAHLGLVIPQADADWPAVRKHVRGVINRIRGGSPKEARAGLAARGIELISGAAQFAGPHEIAVGKRKLKAARAIIATGTRPAVPEIEGLRQVGFITNREAVALRQLPRRLAIVGAGSVGIEFAQLFARFGVRVTVLQQESLPLEQEDKEMARALCKLLEGEGIRIVVCSELHCATGKDGARRISYGDRKGSRRIEVDEILVATGREAALAGLNLAAAGVEVHDKGVIVDENLRTSAAHIWAAGDIAGSYPFTHVAAAQGKLAAQNAFASQPQPFDTRAIPWVTYTDPELAHLGQTEEELQEAGTAYRVARMPLRKLDRAIAADATAGLVKLLVGADERLLGAHILGAAAGEMIAPLVLAMKAGLGVKMIAETILAYPTMAEAVRWAADEVK